MADTLNGRYGVRTFHKSTFDSKQANTHTGKWENRKMRNFYIYSSIPQLLWPFLSSSAVIHQVMSQRAPDAVQNLVSMRSCVAAITEFACILIL
jgi:hypothetical protein